jgi:flagellar biosynthesis protein FlhA
MGIAFVVSRQQNRQKKQDEETAQDAERETVPLEDPIESFLAIDPMELEIGVALIRLADPERGGDLLPRITGVRQAIASEIGILLPKVRIRDNMQLDERHYGIKIANNVVAEGSVYPDRLLAMESGLTEGKIPGEETRDPAFGQPAVWIELRHRERAEMLGYTCVEPAAVLATHLKEVVRQHADELLTRDACKKLIDDIKNTTPAVVDELIPGLMKLGEVQQVLQMLLREQIPIRQLEIILETLGDYAARTKDPMWLTEYVRHRLARTISTRFRDRAGRLHVVTLDPALEDRIAAGVEQGERGLFIRMSPPAIETTCRLIGDEVAKLTKQNHPQIVLVSPQIRPALKQLSNAHLSNLVVLSYNEITRDTTIESVALVSDAT